SGRKTGAWSYWDEVVQKAVDKVGGAGGGLCDALVGALATAGGPAELQQAKRDFQEGMGRLDARVDQALDAASEWYGLRKEAVNELETLLDETVLPDLSAAVVARIRGRFDDRFETAHGEMRRQLGDRLLSDLSDKEETAVDEAW